MININKERLLASFCEMVEIASVSGQEAEFRDYIISQVRQRGLTAKEDNAGDVIGAQCGNLLIKLPGTVEAPALLLAAHMDTVVPGEGITAVITGDSVIRSAGNTILGSDDKAGIAAILEAIDVIQENGLNHPPLEILFTVGEEQGLLGAKNFDYSLLSARMGYVLDCGGAPGEIVVQSPCQNEIEYVVHGKAAHAGINPEDGLNAIQIMARALAKMPCGRIDQESTCNFGTIEGGQARNIVAEECRVTGEARSLKRDKLDQLTTELKQIFESEVKAQGAVAEVNIEFLYDEICLEEEEEVVEVALRAAQKVGLQTSLQSTGGGSDASVINGAGIRCANLGIGMTDVHTTNEHIKVEDLINDARWVVELICQRCQNNRPHDTCCEMEENQ